MTETPFFSAQPVDDCWNRIGIYGDQSCERLARHIHCRNCEVYADSAADLLDRLAASAASSGSSPWELASETAAPDDLLEIAGFAGGALRAHEETGSAREVRASAGAAEQAGGVPLLIVRVGTEWLGMPAGFVSQVAPTAVIHSLPRLRSKAVLGVTNIRGQLTVCVSLARLLDLHEAGDHGNGGATDGGQHVVRGAHARFVVGQDQGDESRTVFPVDDVYGIARFQEKAYRPVPATLTHASASHTRAIVDWRNVSVGVLDGDKLFETLRRSLG